MINKAKSIAFLQCYLGALVSMSILFLITMYNHERGIDFEYLIHALFEIIWLASLSGFIGIIFIKIHPIFKFLIGIIVGPLTAATYLYITLY